MDPQFTASKEELYHVQMDVKHVQAVQLNHADRLLRLEKRQADDAALKSVWGASSPFPSVLSGTPQHGPVQNPTDVFDDFDDEQGQNLLGSLELEADEEPVRRGASRANSVRFDVSALQGSNWGQGSRNSGEFVRPASGLGSHPMTERSLSHKSDGRNSSAGHSVHSLTGRTSSLGLDTNFMIGGQGSHSPLDMPDPPPGLFLLGSVPSIIRCWLTTNFSHAALLYAVVCTGSQKSVLEHSLVKELGLLDQIREESSGRQSIRLSVYLPEAIITQPTSRSNSPAPQLPALTADFEIVGATQRVLAEKREGIRVFLGSDTLRAHNADLLLSQNLMTLYGDDRSKLSVPFVRPEDENLFRNLCTVSVLPEKNELKATAPSSTDPRKVEPPGDAVAAALSHAMDQRHNLKGTELDSRIASTIEPQRPLLPASTSDLNSIDQSHGDKPRSDAGNRTSTDSDKPHLPDNITQSDLPNGGSSSDSIRQESSGGIWGSWRQAANGGERESTSGYQQPTRGGRSMKVLKPSKSISTGTTASALSSSRTGAAYEPVASRASGESRRKSQAENLPLRWESKRANSDEQKGSRSIAPVPGSSNPVGGASAFAWMNPNKPKAPAATAE